MRAGDVLAYLDTYPLRVAETRQARRWHSNEARERLQAETQYAQAVLEQSEQAVRVLEISLDARAQGNDAGEVDESRRSRQSSWTIRNSPSTRPRANCREPARSCARRRLHSRARAAWSRLQSAEAKVKAAEAQLELSIIRAPIDGEILKVFTYPGERIGNDPILKMGDTSDMHVIAEVHETDVGAVRIGQRATITSQRFA